ncbi:UNKNOWN [Stylonychia lemnae]|uniref:Tetratricopeptide repeat protein n=1 Tax=Stylonychia lemnae TaxID=5949 RepID=A0A077ZVR0_STYLE|nr:UNKNOWN [Stylonychia lemnae]|eukprot:CDW73330.1 UNKNOWN [Stylonychia lemnae]
MDYFIDFSEVFIIIDDKNNEKSFYIFKQFEEFDVLCHLKNQDFDFDLKLYALISIVKLIQNMAFKNLTYNNFELSSIFFDKDFRLLIRDASDIKISDNKSNNHIRQIIFDCFDEDVLEVPDIHKEFLDETLKLLINFEKDIDIDTVQNYLANDNKIRQNESIISKLLHRCTDLTQKLLYFDMIPTNLQDQKIKFQINLCRSQIYLENQKLEECLEIAEENYQQIICKHDSNYIKEEIQFLLILVRLYYLRNIDIKGYLTILFQYFNKMNDQELKVYMKYAFRYYCGHHQYSSIVTQVDEIVKHYYKSDHIHYLKKSLALNYLKDYSQSDESLAMIGQIDSYSLQYRILLVKLHRNLFDQSQNYQDLITEINNLKQHDISLELRLKKNKLQVLIYMKNRDIQKALDSQMKVISKIITIYADDSYQIMQQKLILIKIYVKMKEFIKTKQLINEIQIRILDLQSNHSIFVHGKFKEEFLVCRIEYYIRKGSLNKAQEIIDQFALVANQQKFREKIHRKIKYFDHSKSEALQKNVQYLYYMQEFEQAVITQTQKFSDKILIIKSLIKQGFDQQADINIAKLQLNLEIQNRQKDFQLALKLKILKLIVDINIQRIQDQDEIIRHIEDFRKQIQQYSQISQSKYDNQNLQVQLARLYYRLEFYQESYDFILNQLATKTKSNCRIKMLRIFIKTCIHLRKFDEKMELISEAYEQLQEDIGVYQKYKLSMALGNYYLAKKSYLQAQIMFDKANIYQNILFNSKATDINNTLQLKLAVSNRLLQSLDEYQQHLIILGDKNLRQNLQILYYHELGNQSCLSKNHREAEKCFLKSNDIFEESDQQSKVKYQNIYVENLISIGYCLRLKNDILGALNYGKQAEIYLDKKLLLGKSKSLHQSQIREKIYIKLMCFISRMLIIQKEFERAILYLQNLADFIISGGIIMKSIANMDLSLISDAYCLQLFTTYVNLGSCHFSLREYLQSKECIDHAFVFIKDRNIQGISKQQAKTYENLGKVCEKLNLFEESVKAYQMMIKFEIPSDDHVLSEEIISTNQNDNSILIYKDNFGTELTTNFKNTQRDL